jgi:hypothetical protein
VDDVDVGLCDRVDDLNLGPMDQMVNNAVDLCSNFTWNEFNDSPLL